MVAGVGRSRTSVGIALVGVALLGQLPLLAIGTRSADARTTPRGIPTHSVPSIAATTRSDTESWIERWAPIAANLASIVTAVVAVSAGIVAFRKFVGARVFQPRIWIELDGHIAHVQGGSVVAVNMTLENKGVRTVVVRGDNSRESDAIWSYVSVIPMSGEELHSPHTNLAWRADSEVALLLGEQRDPPRDVHQELPPETKTEFPFLIPVVGKPVAAKVAAQIYAEDIGARHGAYHHAEKVL
jgi:hypothetical protein